MKDLVRARASDAPAGAPAPRRVERPEPRRHDLLALAAEAASDRAFDESAKARVTQEDIRRLLERRRKERK